MRSVRRAKAREHDGFAADGHDCDVRGAEGVPRQRRGHRVAPGNQAGETVTPVRVGHRGSGVGSAQDEHYVLRRGAAYRGSLQSRACDAKHY